jgi:hypothetical protein
LLFVATVGIFASFLAWSFVLLVLGLLGTYLLAYNALIFSKAPATAKLTSVAAMGPIGVLALVQLLLLAWAGPPYFWNLFWTDGGFRLVWVVLVVLLIGLAYVAHGQSLREIFRANLDAMGGPGWWNGQIFARVLAIPAIQFLLLGGVMALVGLDPFLRGINNELLVLPAGLSKILGISTHLGIPDNLPALFLYIGGGALVVSVVVGRYGGFFGKVRE